MAPDDRPDGLDELLPPLKGHNQPPSDVEILQQRLAEETAGLLERRDALLGAVERAPTSIEDEEACGKLADLARLIGACRKAAEDKRVGAKEPFLASERAVDGFFRKIIDPLDKAKILVQARLTSYQRKKAEEERLRREAEARRAAAEAERQRQAAAEAARTLETEQDLDAAIAAESAALQARADASQAGRAAEARAAELSRSRGDYGAVASLRTFWDFDGLDREAIDLAALRPYLPQDALEKAVRAYIKANFQPGHPGQQIAGVRIFENTSTSVR